MGDLTTHFSRHEFACSDGCGLGEEDHGPDRDLLERLERLRAIVDRPIWVNSGFRCQIKNRQVGGSHSSQHLTGRAADIAIPGVPPLAVAWLAQSLGFRGIKCYSTWTHVDTRQGPVWRAGF